MRYPRHPAAGKQAHTIAGPEVFVGVLGDGAQLTVVELDRDLQSLFLGRALLDGIPCDAAGDRAKDRTDGAALTAADIAASHATHHAAGYRADAALGTFN